MATAGIHLSSIGIAWRNLRFKLKTRSISRPCCLHLQTLWARLCWDTNAVLLSGVRYCVDRCLEQGLSEAIEQLRSTRKRTVVPHRIPLGLLLLSRQQLTTDQLRTALAAQRTAGRGRLGEWLLTLGFVTEEAITAALARQWSCPVLRTHSLERRPCRSPHIPVQLLEAFAMIPLDYVTASSTLHVAFSDGLDHSVLYAIEKMTGVRTAPCLAPPSLVRANLQTFLRGRRENELAFECHSETAEYCRIIRSYVVRLRSGEIRLAACGPYVWARLLRDHRPCMDLLFRTEPLLTPTL